MTACAVAHVCVRTERKKALLREASSLCWEPPTQPREAVGGGLRCPVRVACYKDHEIPPKKKTTTRHNGVSHWWARILHSIGYSAQVKEIFVGASTHPPHRQQRIDGIGKTILGSGRAVGFDATVGSALNAKTLRKAAREDHVVTRKLTKDKRKLKEGACAAKNMDFLAVAMDSYSALAEGPRDLIIEGYQERRETAKTSGEKWAVAIEGQRLVAALSAAVQKGNASIFYFNADPVAGKRPTKSMLPNDVDLELGPFEW